MLRPWRRRQRTTTACYIIIRISSTRTTTTSFALITFNRQPPNIGYFAIRSCFNKAGEEGGDLRYPQEREGERGRLLIIIIPWTESRME